MLEIMLKYKLTGDIKKNSYKMENQTFTDLFKIIKEYIHNKPRIKKTAGVILILIGLTALVTPFTPGSWLAFIGFELLGVRILFSDKLKFLKRK